MTHLSSLSRFLNGEDQPHWRRHNGQSHHLIPLEDREERARSALGFHGPHATKAWETFKAFNQAMNQPLAVDPWFKHGLEHPLGHEANVLAERAFVSLPELIMCMIMNTVMNVESTPVWPHASMMPRKISQARTDMLSLGLAPEAVSSLLCHAFCARAIDSFERALSPSPMGFYQADRERLNDSFSVTNVKDYCYRAKTTLASICSLGASIEWGDNDIVFELTLGSLGRFHFNELIDPGSHIFQAIITPLKAPDIGPWITTLAKSIDKHWDYQSPMSISQSQTISALCQCALSICETYSKQEYSKQEYSKQNHSHFSPLLINTKPADFERLLATADSVASQALLHRAPRPFSSRSHASPTNTARSRSVL